MEKVVKRFFDDEFFVVAKSSTDEIDHFFWIDFVVYEVPATDSDGKRYFNVKGYTGSGEYVENYEEAEIFIKGYLKWDGCTEWDFVDVGHFCGRESAHILTRIIDALYDMAVSEFGFSESDLK